MGLKSVVLVAAVPIACSSIGVASASAAPEKIGASTSVMHGSAPCTPKTSTVAGGPATNFCGPATATLSIGGKTYSFRNGYCTTVPGSGFAAFIILGTFAQGKKHTGVPGNGGMPTFTLNIASKGVSQLSAVYSGGKELVNLGSVSAAGNVTESGASKGTFKSAKSAIDISGKPFSVSGSWNCHGVFVKT